MKKSRKKSTVIIAIVLLGFLVYLGYRVIESREAYGFFNRKGDGE